jgi:hypothetical protein
MSFKIYITYIFTLALFLSLASATTTLTPDDKMKIETTVEKYLMAYPEIVYASAQVDSADRLNVRVVPARGNTTQESFGNLARTFEYATHSYVDSLHQYMMLDSMRLTIEVNGTKATMTATCYPDWARKVKYEPNNKANETDLMICTLRTISSSDISGV